MTRVSVVWECEVCGKAYCYKLGAVDTERLHPNNDCDSDYKLTAWLPQGWRETSYGVLCDECQKAMENLMEQRRKEQCTS